MSKSKNLLLILLLVVVVLVVVMFGGSISEVKRSILKNKIKRRKNTVADLTRKEHKIKSRLLDNSISIEDAKSELDKIKIKKGLIKEEVEGMTDEELSDIISDFVSGF